MSAGCLVALLAVVGLPLMVALLVFAFQDAGVGRDALPPDSAFDGAVSDIPINAGDERAMHEAGLPARRDVLEWHETGRWGYGRFENGEYVVRTFDELPDGADVWHDIYGLDNADPAFRYR